MKRLILHIGTHKTGTTAVQSFLRANAGLLLRDAGIFYPIYPWELSSTTVARNGHFLHCQAYLRAKDYQKRVRRDEEYNSEILLDVFKQQLEEHDTILLSDEQLWYSLCTMKGYLGHLRDIIGECGVDRTDIVVYFRRQDEYLESYWKQWIKSDMHTSRTFEEHLETQETRIMRYLDYARGIRRLEQAFGEGSVIVRRYQRKDLINGDMRYDFADAVGFTITDEYEFPEVTDDPRMPKGNVSLSNNLTEIMRVVNQSPTYHDRFYNEFRNAARATSLVSSESARKTSVLSAEQRAEVLERCQKGNAFIARKYFGIKSGRLFDPPEEGIEQWAPDALSLLRDSELYFAELIAQMATRIDALEEELAEVKKPLPIRAALKAHRIVKRLREGDDADAESQAGAPGALP